METLDQKMDWRFKMCYLLHIWIICCYILHLHAKCFHFMILSFFEQLVDKGHVITIFKVLFQLFSRAQIINIISIDSMKTSITLSIRVIRLSVKILGESKSKDFTKFGFSPSFLSSFQVHETSQRFLLL